jgi:hypothetical protein
MREYWSREQIDNWRYVIIHAINRFRLSFPTLSRTSVRELVRNLIRFREFFPSCHSHEACPCVCGEWESSFSEDGSPIKLVPAYF